MRELSTPIYVINLESRADRLIAVQDQLTRSKLVFEVVKGIDATELPIKNPGFLSNGAFACWLSHRKALKCFVNSGFDYGIIAEDDLKIKNLNDMNSAIAVAKANEIDLLQIGFLSLNFRYYLDITFANFENYLLRLLKSYSQRKFPFSKQLKKKVRISRVMQSKLRIVPDDIRAGAHFYLISKKMATEILELRDPFFLSFDGFLVSLAWSRRFRMFRLQKSLVAQDSSPSSIKPWGVISGELKHDN